MRPPHPGIEGKTSQARLSREHTVQRFRGGSIGRHTEVGLSVSLAAPVGQRQPSQNPWAVKRWLTLAGLALGLISLVGCREVRVKTLAQGTTTVLGGNQILIVRDTVTLSKLGIHAPVHFKSEFGAVLLMGPHSRTGYKQIVESIRAGEQRVRIVAFEQEPADGGEPSDQYRTYTLWIVPNSVYRRGVPVEVVTPSDEPIADTVLP